MSHYRITYVLHVEADDEDQARDEADQLIGCMTPEIVETDEGGADL